MAEGASNKDVVYVDVDDEITGIIDKVRSSGRQIVALVIPKRSAVLQSIVNMKLLKRTADAAKKNVVLITSDEGLLPLAGSVGMHVARNLQSKPEIPPIPTPVDIKPDAIEEPVRMAGDFNEPAIDKSKTVGELTGVGAVAAAAEDGDIELDNSEDAPETPADDGGKKNKKNKKEKKAKKNKALMVPNFNRFRTWILIGVCLLIVLIILIVVALSVLPKATITVDTNSQSVASNLQLTLSSNATSADPTAEVVPAQTAQSQKSYTGTANATGQQNNGQKATGSVTLSLTDCAQSSVTIPAGTGISSNNLTFITQNSVTLNSVQVGSHCDNSSFSNFSSASVNVVAQNGGSNYNIQPSTFTVPNESDVTGSSSQSMSGGTDDIQQIVTQADITSAQNKINTDTSAVKSQLESDLQSQGLYAIPATFTSTTPSPSPSVAANSPGSSVTVNENITYTMYGVKQSDLQTVIASSVNSQISTKSQKILNYGLGSATFTSQGGSSGSEMVSMQDNALVGFALNPSTIKSRVAGQKPGSAEATIRGYSGVTNANVHLSPFWVSSIPKKTSKITVTIDNPKN
jgi:hypothetical protein